MWTFWNGDGMCGPVVVAICQPVSQHPTVRSRRQRGGGSGLLGRHARAVWVDLRAAYPGTAGDVDALPNGLDLDREVPGGLWEWVRASDGRWFGVVTLHIPYRDDRAERYIADRQLIPARALRPR